MESLNNWVELAFETMEKSLSKEIDIDGISDVMVQGDEAVLLKEAFEFPVTSAVESSISSPMNTAESMKYTDDFSYLLNAILTKKPAANECYPTLVEPYQLVASASIPSESALASVQTLSPTSSTLSYSYDSSVFEETRLELGQAHESNVAVPEQKDSKKYPNIVRKPRKLPGKSLSASDKFVNKAERNAFRAEKNKLAARDFRQRKKEQMARLEAEVQTLSAERANLCAELHRVKAAHRVQIDDITAERDRALAELAEMKIKVSGRSSSSPRHSVCSASSEDSLATLHGNDVFLTPESPGKSQARPFSVENNLDQSVNLKSIISLPNKNSVRSCVPYNSMVNSSHSSLHVH